MEIIENRDAQFLLLAGFIVAMGLVITALLLNAMIFTGSMALEAGTDTSKDEIINLIEMTNDELKNAYRNATNSSGTPQTKISYFTKQMRNFSTEIPKIYALHGEGVNITWDASNWNDNRYPNFTENGLAGGTPNWTVVEGVNASLVSDFTFSNLNLFPGKSYTIEAGNSTGIAVWSVELNSTNDYTMKNTTGTSYGTYNPSSVNLTLPEYYFKGSISEPVSLRIINGNNAYGEFKIQGTANNRIFYRERHYILNATVRFSTNRVRANLSIPVSVPR